MAKKRYLVDNPVFDADAIADFSLLFLYGLYILQEGSPTEKKESQANLFTQCTILTRRSFINMYRDLGYYWLRLAIYTALGFGLGSVFYNVRSSRNSIHVSLKCVILFEKHFRYANHNHIKVYFTMFMSIQEIGSLLLFVASLLTIMAIGGFPSFVEDLKVS